MDTNQEKITYVLYARKSSENEDRQMLSIDAQVKEMKRLADKEHLTVRTVLTESGSAKAVGTREVFNGMVSDLKNGIYNGIITWATDRLSRNAGDLGTLVDLMDQEQLKEIRTYGQIFTNNPNEKFLLMILGSQAKLENDHKSMNIRRGLRTRVESGLWPGYAPLGYINHPLRENKCELVIDKERAPTVKKIFEKAADGWSGRKIHRWLKKEGFMTRGDKPLSLSGIYRLLTNPFYYGTFEYPKDSGNWYIGRHKPLISKELFEKVHHQLGREKLRREASEFAFTKMIICGMCNSRILGEQKFIERKDGTVTRCVYYGCSRLKHRECKNAYIKEVELMKEIAKHLDNISLNELGVKMHIEEETKRIAGLQKAAGLGTQTINPNDVDIKVYAKHILREGAESEKRKLLAHLRSVLVYVNKRVEVLK